MILLICSATTLHLKLAFPSGMKCFFAIFWLPWLYFLFHVPAAWIRQVNNTNGQTIAIFTSGILVLVITVARFGRILGTVLGSKESPQPSLQEDPSRYDVDCYYRKDYSDNLKSTTCLFYMRCETLAMRLDLFVHRCRLQAELFIGEKEQDPAHLVVCSIPKRH